MTRLYTTQLKYVLPIALLYSAISLAGMFHHEIFGEEAQQLTIGRDSSSVIDVYKNMLYEGHVTLWNTLLFFITHYVSAHPMYMQLFHLLVISCAMYLFLRYAPFDLPVKVLIIFGCYFLFVYSIVCRNYALGILLLFAGCILMANPGRNMIRIGLVVVLMCFTHLFYVFAAVGIFLYLLVYVRCKRELYRRFVVFTCLFLFGAVSAVFETLRIPADSIVHIKKGLSWLNFDDISFGIRCFVRGYITNPPTNVQYFWDKQYVQTLSDNTNMILAVLLFAATLLFLRKSRKAILFYVPPVIFLSAFFTITGAAGTRYFGLYFIFFIAALWLAYYDGVTIFPKGNPGFIRKWGPRAFIYIILIDQLFTGVYMYRKDFRAPFSQANNTVSYLKANHLDTDFLAVDGYCPTLSAYLGKKTFYLNTDQYGSFCIWKRAYIPNPRRSLMDEISSSKQIKNFKTFILISNRTNEVNNNGTWQFNKLASFEGAIIEGEDYYIYKATKKIN
jgi:hypothetical protein